MSDETPTTRSRSAVDWTRIRVTPEIHRASTAYLLGRGPLALGDVLALIADVEVQLDPPSLFVGDDGAFYVRLPGGTTVRVTYPMGAGFEGP